MITSGKAGVPKLDGSLREGREPIEMQKSAAQSGKWVLGLLHLFLVSLSQITPLSAGAQGNIGGIHSSRTVTCNVSTPPESSKHTSSFFEIHAEATSA